MAPSGMRALRDTAEHPTNGSAEAVIPTLFTKVLRFMIPPHEKNMT
jgi:hypothetical protein